MKARWSKEPTRSGRKWILTFETEETPRIYDETQDRELNINIDIDHKKRSLNANAYAWKLCAKIGQKTGLSRDNVYDEMVQRYGAIDTDDTGDPIVINIKQNIDVSRLGGHWKRIDEDQGYITYMRLKGSSEMDTKEMADFIDGIKSECNDLGIDPQTPAELEAINQWKAL